MTSVRGLGLAARLTVVAVASGLTAAMALLARGDGPWPMLAASLAAALVCRLLGHILLVRPTQRLLDSLAALDPATPDRSLAEATQGIGAIAHQLRLAEWRQARLGAIAAGAGRVSHDLRGTLAPALLAAERLQLHAEPGIKRVGDITVRAVERAIELVRSSVDFARDGHQPAPATRFPLDGAVAEAVATARAAMPHLAITVTQDAAADVTAAREYVVRSLCYLLRHRGAAPATAVKVAVHVTSNGATLDIAGDGPLAAAPFSPFGDAAGLQLATARDLARSAGGGIALERDEPGGPVLRLTLPATAVRPAA